jgi:hypothetical protein
VPDRKGKAGEKDEGKGERGFEGKKNLNWKHNTSAL